MGGYRNQTVDVRLDVRVKNSLWEKNWVRYERGVDLGFPFSKLFSYKKPFDYYTKPYKL
jgi:hypothetical protein